MKMLIAILMGLLAIISVNIGMGAVKDAKVQWCTMLAYDGGGYWTKRLPVVVKNTSTRPVMDGQLSITLSTGDGTSDLIGIPVKEIRVANDAGTEYMFELQDAGKLRKRSGSLEAGDIITIPVEAGVDSSTVVFIYGGNPRAWLPPDIRGFSDNPDWSKRSVNEWLEVIEDKQLRFSDINVEIKEVESIALRKDRRDASWLPGLEWKYRIPVFVRNFTSQNMPVATVTLKTRRINNRLGKLFGFDVKPAFCMIDPVNPEQPMDLSESRQENFRVMLSVGPMTEKIIWLYVSKNPDIEGQSRFVELFREIHDSTGLDAVAGEPEARNKQERPLAAWVVSPLVKVFQADLFPEEANQVASIYVSRNSGKSFQIALRSLKNMQVRVLVSVLKNAEGETLPVPDIYKVGYVPVDFPVRYYRTPEISDYIRYKPLHAGSDGWRDWWPDPLIPLKEGSPFDLKANSTQPIWFDLSIQENTTAGIYTGQVIIESSNGKTYVPLSVKVWKLVLPDKRHIPAVYDLRKGLGKNPFGKNMPDEKAWSRYLAKFNVSPGMLAEPEFTYKNGKVHMETKEFDSMARFLFDELNNTMMYTPGFFFSVGWYSGAKPIFGLQPFTQEYVKAWKEAYKLFIDHVTKKGWRKYFVLYLSDEPRIPLAFNAIARVADIAREVAPDVPIYVSAWDYVDEIAGHISAWGIGAQGQVPARIIKERKTAGDIFIYTTDGQQSLDTPFPATERLMPWFCFKYGVSAFEFWGSTWWTFDPWKYGWHAFVKEGGGEEVINPVRYPNGDGYIVYPGDGAGIPGPVPSIRLMAIREGVDDFEVFHALEKYERAGDANAREILNEVRNLVIVPNRGGMWATSFMPDPEAVIRARVLAGEILDRLTGK